MENDIGSTVHFENNGQQYEGKVLFICLKELSIRKTFKNVVGMAKLATLPDERLHLGADIVDYNRIVVEYTPTYKTLKYYIALKED